MAPLAVTAKLVRAWNRGHFRGKIGSKQSDFKLVQTEFGGRLLLKTHPEAIASVRVSSHLHVSMGYLKNLFAQALLSKGKPAQIGGGDRPRALCARQEGVSVLSFLCPHKEGGKVGR